MKKLFLAPLFISSITAGLLLVGCDEGTTSESSATELSGQLVDAHIENADYVCADGKKGVTDSTGTFTCASLPVQFKLGGLTLGEVAVLPSDKQVFPQDLLGLNRTDTNNSEVIAMARLLQSCDSDNNPANGIQIREAVKTALKTEIKFNADDIASYTTITVDETSALEHLNETTSFTEAVNASGLPANVIAALLGPKSTLTQEIKETFAYMGNEERLAYDVYTTLYKTYPLNPLNNIATKSETKHIQTVQLVVQKYISDYAEFGNVDLEELEYKDAALETMQTGVYDIQKIQELYNQLIVKGKTSEQDALEVGCIVEVVDIDDLNEFLELAHESNASDVVTAFEFLREGSYSHYWTFDAALKNRGVAQGCCVLGEEYCHPEYPQPTKGKE